ncbi:class I adenylate-forming enzyme family protein [Orrella sp. JC864]|uniref:class I adenylate-forming enzyme family protein n=1 Tax=Orrella sp. JC864 TaxID=3120298 RepID=UPI003009F345
MNPPTRIPWSLELHTLARRHGERTAVQAEDGRLCYAGLNRRAHGLAARLLREGVTPGACVGIYLPNGVDAVWADYGVTLSGACLVHLNAAYTREEVEWGLRLAPMRVILTDRAGMALLQGLPARLLCCEDIDPIDDPQVLPAVPADAWGRIIFSSGTTGKPKGLVYDHGRRWLAAVLLRAMLPWVPQPGSRILLMTPYVHGASMLARAWLDNGGCVELRRGVDPAQAGALLRAGSLEALFAPPTVLAKLAAALGEQSFPGLRCLFTGTQTLTPGLYARARALFGPCVRVTYGKSENVNPITVLDPADTDAAYAEAPGDTAPGACLGWPAPGVELRIGQGDEILLRSQHMYIGYVDAEGFHPPEADGWHRTGDLGRIDARGRLWLLGRMADVIKSGGYKIYPDEIEAALAGTPGCGPICVAALPSDYWGEVIVAVAEQADPAQDWAAQARERVAGLARYKHPRAYVTLDELPRNPQGKISRRAVREAVMARWGLVDGAYPELVRRGVE